MKFVIIVHNIRSAHNVGSIFRTADGVGADMIYISGYSPTPADKDALYITKAEKMFAKTALGAEKTVKWKKAEDIFSLISDLKKEGFEVVALEQDKKSLDYKKFKIKKSVALIIGNEPKGIDDEILEKCDSIIEIPMRGSKKSLNVSVAFGIAAYEIYNKIN